MSDFIGDLEHELRAASTRRVRLAAARAPRLPATAVAFVVSLAVCIAVAGAVLVGHAGHATSTTPAPKQPTTSPIAPAGVGNQVVRDCLKHGSLAGRYTAPQLRQALRSMPTAVRKYTNCTDLITTALQRAAAAPTVTLVNADPTTLFQHSTQAGPNPGQQQTVIASTVRKLAAVDVPGVGPVQAWIADTEQHGRCWGLLGPHGWLALSMDNHSAGAVPGCAATRTQEVLRQGNSPVGLAPTSSGRAWDIYYGTVTADGAAAVRDQTTGKTAPLISGQYFILVERQTTNCDGCDNLRAIDAAGSVLPANYGPVQYRNH
jgi:hypothetical protein